MERNYHYLSIIGDPTSSEAYLIGDPRLFTGDPELFIRDSRFSVKSPWIPRSFSSQIFSLETLKLFINRVSNEISLNEIRKNDEQISSNIFAKFDIFFYLIFAKNFRLIWKKIFDKNQIFCIFHKLNQQIVVSGNGWTKFRKNIIRGYLATIQRSPINI